MSSKSKKKVQRKKKLTPKEQYGPLNTAIRNFREAAITRKFHAIPGHDYTTGQHSHAVMQLLLLLHPAPSLNLVKAAMALGLSSRWLGDRTPQVSLISSLAAARSMAETKILEELKQNFPLNPDEQEWLSGLDLAVVYLWCQDQLVIGNRNVGVLIQMVQTELKARAKLPEQLKAFMSVASWSRVGP